MGAARRNSRCPGDRVDAHALHHGKIDDQSVVDAGEPRPVVPAPADRHAQAIFAPEIHRRHHIRRVRAAGDQERLLVDHPVVELAGLLIGLVASLDQGSAQIVAQFRDCFLAHDFLPQAPA